MGVIVAQAGDHRDQRSHDVGGIQPPAKPDLRHQNIHALPLEVKEAQRRRQLEPGQARDGIRRRLEHGQQRGKLVLADHAVIHPEALTELLQMRRRVQPDAQAGRL